MKKSGRIIIVTMLYLVLVPLCLIASANDVKYFYNPANGNVCWIDLQSISRSANVATAKVLWEFDDHITYQGVASISMEVEADCKKNTLVSVRSKSYSLSGKQIQEDLQPVSLPLADGTKQAATFDIMCGKKTAYQTLRMQFISQNSSSSTIN